MANADAMDAELVERIQQVRERVHQTFGQAALAMMALPRYRHLAIADLNHLVLEPLIRDRVAMASAEKPDNPTDTPLAGIAIWASVSDEVDANIREQIKAGVFPVRLRGDEWTSGNKNWLLDVISPNQKLTASVIANFRQVLKEGDLRIHPLVTRLVDPDVLKKMGATPVEGSKA